jgi:hypothetical protein
MSTTKLSPPIVQPVERMIVPPLRLSHVSSSRGLAAPPSSPVAHSRGGTNTALSRRQQPPQPPLSRGAAAPPDNPHP